MTKFKIFSLIAFSLFLVLLAATAVLVRQFFVPVGEGGKREIAVHEGSRATEIAELLQSEGLIRNVWSFQLLLFLTQTSERIQAGYYEFSPPLSEYEVLLKLVHGEGVKVEILIPDGFTNRQIAELLEAHQIVGENEFLKACSQTRFRIPAIHFTRKGLEGFLFPDTYEFSLHRNPEEVYGPMLKRFQQLVMPAYQKSGKKRNLQKIVTIASLVEREGKLHREFPLIAAVYYNRLKKGIPLQCDATIQYLLPKPKLKLTEQDLRIHSPYNTYLHPGLPPGAIANPGFEAIQAALYPAQVPYLYYVAKGDGSHVFSVDYQHHRRAVKEYWNRLRHFRGKII